MKTKTINKYENYFNDEQEKAFLIQCPRCHLFCDARGYNANPLPVEMRCKDPVGLVQKWYFEVNK